MKTICAACRSAARKWGSPQFASLYTFKDRCILGLEACMFHRGKICAADNPGQYAYRVAYNMLAKTFREEFPAEVTYTPTMCEDGVESCIGDEYGASGSNFEIAGSPNIYSAMRAEEFERQMLDTFDAALAKLPEAMVELDPMERTIIKLYYYGEMSGPDIADALSMPVRSVYNHLDRAIEKFRKFFGIRTDRAATCPVNRTNTAIPLAA